MSGPTISPQGYPAITFVIPDDPAICVRLLYTTITAESLHKAMKNLERFPFNGGVSTTAMIRALLGYAMQETWRATLGIPDLQLVVTEHPQQ